MLSKNSPFNAPGDYYCNFCGKKCKNKNSKVNHERFCKLNPHRRISAIEVRNNDKSIAVWNKGITAQDDSRVRARVEVQKQNYRRNPSGYHYGHSQSEETRRKLRAHALRNGLGGFHMRRGHLYNGLKLDSSYEVLVATELDANNIRWERCKRFKYQWEDGSIHFYTPDFYLPDYDVYLDPKNDYLIENVNPGTGIKDSIKIELVQSQNNIKVLILDKNHLRWDAIKELLLVKVTTQRT